MPQNAVRWASFHEPEELMHAIPGVLYRATRLSAGAFEVQLSTFDLAGVVLQVGTSSPCIGFAVAQPATAVIQLPLRHADTLVVNGRTVHPGVVGLYGPGAELMRSNRQDSSHAAIVLPADSVETLLCPPAGTPLLRQGTSGLIEARPEAWSAMIELIHGAWEVSRGTPDAFAVEEAGNALRSSLLGIARELLAGAWAADSPRRFGGLRSLRRLIAAADEYLAAHVARPIYTEELCAALGASPSSLAEAFRTALGISPHRFLKLRRLAMVRAALLSREDPPALVKSIAYSHGFWHLGQFAHDYRALYGETPSETLARARGIECVEAA